MKIQFPSAIKGKVERVKWIKENKEEIVIHAKTEKKFGDAYDVAFQVFDSKTNAFKSVTGGVDIVKLNELDVKVVINSTNYIDSHSDMHIPGIWNKSLKENKAIKFLQEHEMLFKKVMADKSDLKAYTEQINWRDLGLNKNGITECLVFEAKIKRGRNEATEEMIKEYAQGNVDQHSVGMQYVELVFCVEEKNKYYVEENEAWDKYIPLAINPEAAIEDGYFWAVLQAKVIEGSAVVLGSNPITPTLGTEAKEQVKTIPIISAAKRTGIDYDYLIQQFKN